VKKHYWAAYETDLLEKEVTAGNQVAWNTEQEARQSIVACMTPLI
jgi:hypothetical protein